MEITLQQMLDAREARVAVQRQLLDKYGLPLIGFCMNIAGPVKDSPLIRRAFDEGKARLTAALQDAGHPVRYKTEIRAVTGCEAVFVVDAAADVVKKCCVEIEEADALGRLFDLDVLDSSGRKLGRGHERPCLVCGAAGRGCASRRVHSVAQLQAATRAILVSHFALAEQNDISAMVTDALIEEARTTPKPGLVDRANNGSHQDMDLDIFLSSAGALRGYWADCVRIGQEKANRTPEETFLSLREAGKSAERAMYAATGGVNTHKGAIYLFGAICGAVGRLWAPELPCRDVNAILSECAALTKQAVRADFDAIREKPEAELTAGERIYLQYGLTGVRGEAAAGMPSVRKTALPLFRELCQKGLDRNRAGSITLLALIALGRDTNMIARGGMAQATEAAAQAKALLDGPQLPTEAEITALDKTFTAANLSPGGCADLLAVCYFLSCIDNQYNL